MRYRELLATTALDWGLIGPREVERLWSRHVLNSAALAELVPPDARVIDVGSGAGLPGIPLALACPDARIVLLEPLERRARFLTDVVSELGLTERVSVVRARADRSAAAVEPAPYVTARAVAPLKRLVPMLMPLVRRTPSAPGHVLALKGAKAAEELAAAADLLARAGVADARVRTVGSGYLDPPATVVELTVPSR